MGLIKAAVGAAGGVMADQWKEFFYCESMPKEVLVTKGVKRTSGRSSNTRGSDNIITSGSRHCSGRRPVHDDRGAGQSGGALRGAG